jgi:hypothetical protein
MKREPWREKKCLEYQEGIIRFIEANPGLKLVVLSANWTSYERHVGWNGLDLVTGQDAGAIDPTPRTLKFHFERTLAYLTGRGLKVLILAQVPHIGKSREWPVTCAIDAKRNGLKTRTSESRPTPCGPSSPPPIARSGGCRGHGGRERRGLERPPLRQRRVLHRDGRHLGHLNRIGSEYLARYVTLPDLTEPARAKVIGSTLASPPSRK